MIAFKKSTTALILFFGFVYITLSYMPEDNGIMIILILLTMSILGYISLTMREAMSIMRGDKPSNIKWVDQELFENLTHNFKYYSHELRSGDELIVITKNGMFNGYVIGANTETQEFIVASEKQVITLTEKDIVAIRTIDRYGKLFNGKISKKKRGD